jgi:hypothetical protein
MQASDNQNYRNHQNQSKLAPSPPPHIRLPNASKGLFSVGQFALHHMSGCQAQAYPLCAKVLFYLDPAFALALGFYSMTIYIPAIS